MSVVAPVPPFDGFNVPPSTTAPEVGVFGVNPVVPPLNVPVAPGAPAGIPKLNVAAELLPEFVTVGVDP